MVEDAPAQLGAQQVVEFGVETEAGHGLRKGRPPTAIVPLPGAGRSDVASSSLAGGIVMEVAGPVTRAARRRRKPTASEWLAFAFVRDAPHMPNGQYLGIETAPVEPWPHQRIVARRLVDGWPLSWMLCDEVGLGKTIEAGLALRALRLSGFVERVLIAAPASLAVQWQREMADKFLLPFSRALGGARVRHAVLLPGEEERPATSLFAPDLAIVSTGLLTRDERQADLKDAAGWDVVLLDEAHCARRSNPTGWALRPPRWTRLYRVARDVLRGRAASLWLATATPMQLEPIEAIDLAALTRRLGPFGSVPQVALAWYALLGKLREGRDLDPLEWRFVARAAHHVLRLDPATSGFVERTLLRGRGHRSLVRWLATIESDRRPPPRSARKAVMRLLFAVAPLSRAMLRHDRGLLRKYGEQGRLPGHLPVREVHLPAIRLTVDEKAVYDLFAPYCRALAAHVSAHARQRIAVGFMLSFFDLRFASSYKAIHDTLERRRDKVRAALAGRLPELPADEDEWEDRVHDEADAPDEALVGAGLQLRSKADLEWEIDQLDILLERLAPLAQRPSAKVRVVLQILRDRRSPDGRVRQTVVFTRFYDTLVDLQGWIERSTPPVRLGVFAGPRCAWTDEANAWRGSNREEVKRRFVAGDIDVLLCTDAAAEGLNLQSADLLVNFDLPWNPMKLEQRIGRIDRIGQRHGTVHVANLAYPGTVEEEVHVRLQQRIQGAAGTVGAQPVVVLPVRPGDLRRLASGELTPDQLETLVSERLRQAQERAESMTPGADELYALYRDLDGELAANPLPITLEQLFGVLAGSAYLKGLGCEVIGTPLGDALLVKGVPGCKPCLLTVARALYEHGLNERDEPLRFATWGEPAFDALVAHVL
ncbi:MAG: helicase, partial [Burkholderiales bacterium]